MIPITLQKLAEITNGDFLGEKKGLQINAIGLQSDSRKIKSGDIFAPIIGERVDGHDFIPKAFESGAVCCFAEKDCEIQSGQYIVRVKSVVKAMLDLAEYIIKTLNIPVVAVTGSAGKTTTKDIIASVLEQKYCVLKTAGNYNTNIGMPLMAAQLTPQHNIAVFEMGMNSFGEIHNLSIVAKPVIAVITNIGVAHIEMLGSRDGILKAKSEVFDGMDENGIAILNADNDKLQTLHIKQNIIWYGVENKKGIYAEHIQSHGVESISCDIHTPQGDIKANIPVPGEHMVMNTLAACAVGLELGLTLEQIQKGISCFVPTQMRMNIIKTQYNITIINDVYNANPVSMKASIDVLAKAEGRKVAILGFMGELGENQKQMHKEVGEYVAQKKIDVLISIGDVAECYDEGAKQKGMKEVYHFESQQDFWKNTSLLKEGDTVLIKASRSRQFEKTVEKLQGVK